MAGVCSLPGASEALDLGLGRGSRQGAGTTLLQPEPLWKVTCNCRDQRRDPEVSLRGLGACTDTFISR